MSHWKWFDKVIPWVPRGTQCLPLCRLSQIPVTLFRNINRMSRDNRSRKVFPEFNNPHQKRRSYFLVVVITSSYPVRQGWVGGRNNTKFRSTSNRLLKILYARTLLYVAMLFLPPPPSCCLYLKARRWRQPPSIPSNSLQLVLNNSVSPQAGF